MSSEDEKTEEIQTSREPSDVHELPAASNKIDDDYKPAKVAAQPRGDAKASLIDPNAFYEIKRAALVAKEKAKEVVATAKDPQSLKQKIRELLPNRLFLIFFMIWLPFMLIAGGSLSGFFVQLFTKNIHFILGLFAGFYVYKFVHHDVHPHAVKVRVASLVSSLFPFIMIDDSNFFVQLVALFAFCGTPFLLSTYFPAKSKNDDVDTSDEETKNVMLMYSIAPAVTFAIAAGGCSYLNSFFLIVAFSAGLFATQMALPIVLSNPSVPPVVKQLPELIFVVAEILISFIVLVLLQLIIIPEGVQAEENPIWLSLIYIILGVGIVAGGLVLQGRVPQVKIKDDVRAKAQLAITYGVLGSYALLLLVNLGRHALGSFGF